MIKGVDVVSCMFRELVEHPKVVGTPHLGASTVEAQLKVAQEIAQQFVAATKGEGLMGVVSLYHRNFRNLVMSQ